MGRFLVLGCAVCVCIYICVCEYIDGCRDLTDTGIYVKGRVNRGGARYERTCLYLVCVCVLVGEQPERLEWGRDGEKMAK